MILICSAGHKIDTMHPFHTQDKSGDKCSDITHYDRLCGTTYCQRRLYELNKRIAKFAKDILFRKLDCNKYYEGWAIEYITHGIDKRIKQLLMEGEEIKTGYFVTSIRNYHNNIILIKN